MKTFCFKGAGNIGNAGRDMATGAADTVNRSK